MKPLVIAHRGASADAPENTLSAFAEAWRQGADGVELDLRLCADGALAVIHDENLARTCGLPDRVGDLRAGELATVDASTRWPGRPREGVPLLEDVLDSTPAGKRLVLEVKVGPEAAPALRDALADRAELTVDLIAFRLDALVELRRLLPGRPVWWLLAGEAPLDARALEQRLRVAEELGLAGLDVGRSLVDDSFAAALRQRGLPWMAWTIDGPAVARRLAALGAEALTTDRPARLRAWLEQDAESPSAR